MRRQKKNKKPGEDGRDGRKRRGDDGTDQAAVLQRDSHHDERSNKNHNGASSCRESRKNNFSLNRKKLNRAAFRHSHEVPAGSKTTDFQKALFFGVAAPPHHTRTRRGFYFVEGEEFLRGQSEQRTRKQRGGRSLWQRSLRVGCIQGRRGEETTEESRGTQT